MVVFVFLSLYLRGINIISSWLFPLVIIILIILLTIIVINVFNFELYFLIRKTIIDLNFSLLKQNLFFFISILIISLLVFLWGLFYILGREKLTRFFFILFLFVVSILVLVLSNSIFLIFLGWEGLGLTSFLLIIFYQNWIRFQGGLLTLLTNRLGDSILIIRFGYWIFINFSFIRFFLTGFLLILLLFLTLTKRAQVPFTRWLPAAIAAPTPVRALVHSSTLVTAGVWLVIQFGGINIISSILWFFFGRITLLVARLAALIENDTKKVVALSTLRQLGLMYVALYLGGSFITLFHLLIHAFAKANLFLMVGNIIHFRFSQQDIRSIRTGLERPRIFLITMISLLRLIGITFTSGFLSKDLILGRHFSIVNRAISFFLIMSIITLTSTYCYKLFIKLLSCNYSCVITTRRSLLSLLPSSVLRILRLLVGWFSFSNIIIHKLILITFSGFYWTFILITFLLLYENKVRSFFFKGQLNSILFLVNSLIHKGKLLRLKIRRSFLERVFLSYSLGSVSYIILTSRVSIILTLMVTSILMV